MQRLGFICVLIISLFVGFSYLKTLTAYRQWKEQSIAPLLCRWNQRVIADAKTHWASEQLKAANAIPTWKDLLGTNGYITGSQPVCPSGGEYILGRVSEPPRCTHPGHNAAMTNIIERSYSSHNR